jgi:lipopolysaccharide/colanic/teichoic acid biosynthesis glycosyltransferase
MRTANAKHPSKRTLPVAAPATPALDVGVSDSERPNNDGAGLPRTHERYAAIDQRYRAMRLLTAVEQLTGAGVLAPARQRSVEWGLKRAIDIVMGTGLLVLSLPVMALVALLIRCTSRGSVIFRQSRVGRDGREFVMYKFRTMRPDAEFHEERLAKLNGNRVFLKIEGDSRVTPLGRLLRKYSLDEFPQLINVLRGDMSLVGPRPLLPSDLRKFPRGRWARRFNVPPGITGLWQVSGRSVCSDEERIRFDLEYVEHWSIWLDLRILLQTPAVVLLAKGAH